MSGPSGITLTQNKKPDLTKCIICKKGSTSKEKLSNSAGSRCSIINASQKMQDGLLDLLTEVEYQSILFHSTTCYGKYKLRADRFVKPVTVPASAEDAETEEVVIETPSKRPRTRSISSPLAATQKPLDSPLWKTCVICNHVSKDKIREKYRISEKNRAKQLLAAAQFQKDDVFTRCSLYKNEGDVFAADLYSHEACIRDYIRKFVRATQQILDSMEADENDSNIQLAFETLCTTLDLNNEGYEIAGCQRYMNNMLPQGESVSRKVLLKLLLKKYGNEICFSYVLNDWTKPEMFYSTKINPSTLVETIRSSNTVEECAKSLRKECKDYDFGLDNSYCDASDIKISFETYVKNRPANWTSFFKKLLNVPIISKKKQRVCDSIFQMINSLLKENTVTPLSAGFAQSIHDASRNRHLITIGNRLGFNESYDSVQRQDTALALRTIQRTGSHRVPVPASIKSKGIIHGAMDNFDKNDGGQGSHDTILMLFQNSSVEDSEHTEAINTLQSSSQRVLKTTLPCQEILSVTIKRRATIPKNYGEARNIAPVVCPTKFSEYQVWLLLRYMTSVLFSHSTAINKYIPSFSAINSMLIRKDLTLTREAYTPILPYPATEYDSIYTTMKNFQDVLIQKGSEYGALWCDEGVYHIAKELQLLFPDTFGNIFLGLGGFHMEKNILACCSQYLKFIGARDIFVHNEIFGPTVTDKKVMTGKDYKLCRQAMRLISEAVERLRFQIFFENNETDFQNIVEGVHDTNENDEKGSDDLFREKWNVASKDLDEKYFVDFKNFVDEKRLENDKWKYWSVFLDTFMPIVIDLTRSFREGDWDLHISAVRRALPLFFAFGHINYARWAPIYYEDCLNLPTKFPLLYSSFLEGDFVVHLTVKKSSSVPMDQALEMAYNKPAKAPGGVIGFTRRKQAVAKWNIIKHEKSKILSLMDDLCGLVENDEYSLHHEYNDKFTESDEEDIEAIRLFLSSRPDMFADGKLGNIVTGIELPEEETTHLLSCYEEGETTYSTYHQQVLVDCNVRLFDRIKKARIHKKVKQKPKADLSKEKLVLARTVDVARTQGYSIKKLLSYEVLSTSYYLMKDGFMRKAGKSELVKEIRFIELSYQEMKERIEKFDKRINVIDFMAFARRMNSRINKFNLKTFGDVMKNLWDNFWKLGSFSDRIDIVFDLYKPGSVKASERKRRAFDNSVRRCVDDASQPLPKLSELDKYWGCDENKQEFQQLFIKWVLETYVDDKPVFLGGCHPAGYEDQCYKICNGIKSLVPRLQSTHDEADDRIMIHVNHAIKEENFECVLVNSRDSDIFIGLVYHFHTSWKEEGLQEVWVENMEMYAPLHEICADLSTDMVELLPVAHTLTGCDTTSKVGTKKNALAAMKSGKHADLEKFGINELDESMIVAAENFLLKCVSKSCSEASFDSLRHSMYHSHKLDDLDIEKLPCCSSSLIHHIKRAYRQCSSIKNSLSPLELTPDEYGFEFDEEEEGYYPTITTSLVLPEDFPSPCSCGKCAKKNICPCRVKEIKCGDFCRCKGDCKNPTK